MGEKRTAWNSTLPAPSQPLKRSGPIKAKRQPRFKVSGERDEPYRAFVRSQPCVLLNVPGHRCKGPTEACHLKSRGAGGTDRGNLFAACSRSHSEQHCIGIHTFQRVHDVDLPKVCREIEARFVLRDFSGPAAAPRTPHED